MRSAKDIGNLLRKHQLDRAASCQMIERLALVEAGHLHGPFDDRPVSTDFQAAAAVRDRDHAAVDFRRVGKVDRKLLLAGLLALLER